MVMNKTLEALENIKHYDTRVGLHRDDYDTIEKSLKALEIIKEKQPDIYYVVKSKDYEDYLRIEGMFINMNRALTEEEYDLLKEVLL